MFRGARAVKIRPAVRPVLIVRILDEEKELLERLPGYAAYVQKVRRRLIPGIW